MFSSSNTTPTPSASNPDHALPQMKRCSVPGCPTQGVVDETGTCSAHGTKRKRCKMEGCPNGVVQGGVCVKHGAKRRICKYPGCDKNTKSHGLCSKHGPARKKCSVPKCSNVAVRSGRCKSHGAYAAECAIIACSKQAVSGGLCIRHFKEMTVAATAQNAFRYAHVSHAMQTAQGAGLVAMNPAIPMQGMMPMSMPFLTSHMVCPPTQMGMATSHPGIGIMGFPSSYPGAQVLTASPLRNGGVVSGSSNESPDGDDETGPTRKEISQNPLDGTHEVRSN